MAYREIRAPALGPALRPNVWDIVALILVIGGMVLIVYGGKQTTLPLSALDVTPVSLDPANLPLYALRTTMRMLLAIVCSIVFTFIYAAVAAKSRRAEMVLIPRLDILQSVPTDARKKLFAEHLVSYVPVMGLIRRVLDERPSHTAPAARFRDELEDYMSEDYADETLKTIVSWGRYAELFAYDEQSEKRTGLTSSASRSRSLRRYRTPKAVSSSPM
jgi:hypothetical protein